MPAHISSRRYKWNICLHASRWLCREKSSQIYSGKIILTTLSKKVVFFRSALYFFVKNKRLDKRHMRNKWGHISFEVQNQCVLKVVLEAVLWLLVYLHKWRQNAEESALKIVFRAHCTEVFHHRWKWKESGVIKATTCKFFKLQNQIRSF